MRPRTAVLGVVVVASLGAGLAPAFAEVYRTPGNEVAVGTNGEHTHADHLAVSTGGTASTYQGIALSTTGTADGTFAAASGTGCADASYSLLAVSGTGCADAAMVSASGAGNAGYGNDSGSPGLVGVSGNGCAKGTYVGASGLRCAESSTVAASGIGTANGYVAVSGAGQANGSAVGVTGWGNASGGTASVDADRTVGTANGAAWDALADNRVYYNMGINPVPSAYQLWVQATYPAPNPQHEVAKAQAAKEMYPKVVEGLTGEDLPEITGTSASFYEDDTQISDEAPTGTLNQAPYAACLPAASKNTYGHRGMPSYAQLRQESGNGESNGTDLLTMAAVIRKHYVGPVMPSAHPVDDHLDLISKVMASVSNFDQGIIVAVDTAHLWWWTDHYDGRPSPGAHALNVNKYVWMKGTPYAGLWGWDSGLARTYLLWAHDLFIAMSTGVMEGHSYDAIY